MIDKYMKLLEKVYDLFENRKCSAKWFDDTANHIHKKIWIIETKDAA